MSLLFSNDYSEVIRCIFGKNTIVPSQCIIFGGSGHLITGDVNLDHSVRVASAVSLCYQVLFFLCNY